MKKKGFTLTEVLVVIIIIGVLLTIAIPSVIIIRRNINRRLFETKKDTIITAASIYGKDNNIEEENTVYVWQLLNDYYIDPDLKPGEGACPLANEEKYKNGCIVDPSNDDRIINDTRILIRPIGSSVEAIWEGLIGSSDSQELATLVKEKLSCTPTENTPCLFTEEDADNFINESGILWRIIGVYNIDGQELVKLISEDAVYW